MLTHKQLRAKALAKPEVKAEFDQQAGEFELLDQFLKARAAQGLTQAEVAARIGTWRARVARSVAATASRTAAIRAGRSGCPDGAWWWMNSSSRT